MNEDIWKKEIESRLQFLNEVFEIRRKHPCVMK